MNNGNDSIKNKCLYSVQLTYTFPELNNFFSQNCQSQEAEQEEQRKPLLNINNQIRASLLSISQQIHAQKEAKNRKNMETHFNQINNADEKHINYEKVY